MIGPEQQSKGGRTRRQALLRRAVASAAYDAAVAVSRFLATK
jgi:hypothetical protein